MLENGLDGLGGADHDVCLIGAGPIGLALAAKLAKRGRRVLVLESGGARARPEVQALASAELADPERHDDMAIATSRQIGGTSNLWGARAIPFDPIDFAARSWVDARWPIGYDDVAPYFAEAAAATASGAPVYRESFDDTPQFRELAEAGPAFAAAAIERWANEQRAQAIHADAIRDDPRLDVRSEVTVAGIEFADSGAVVAVAARDTRDGRAARIPVKTLVLAAGGLESVRLLLAAQREALDRFGGPEGPLGRYYMGHVVGEIADIVFARPELAAAFDFRVDSHGSYVRRRIVASEALQREHRLLNCAFWPVVPQLGMAGHGSAILSMIYLAMSVGPVGRLLVAEKIRRMHVTPEDSPRRSHLLNLLRGAPGAAAFGVDFLRKRFDRRTRLPGIFVRNPGGRYGLSYHSEQLPNPDSRVTLAETRDRLDVPRLKIDLRFGDEDAAATIRSHALLERWLGEGGIASLSYRIPTEERAASVLRQASHGTHQIGIARMAETRAQGVVDRDLRCFDAPNLYVASTAVLPTSGQANPTFTAMALALRLADRLTR